MLQFVRLGPGLGGVNGRSGLVWRLVYEDSLSLSSHRASNKTSRRFHKGGLSLIESAY